MLNLIACLAVAGQYGYGQTTYRQQYVQTYQQPAYVEKVVFVAREPDPYYTQIVGDQQRAQQRVAAAQAKVQSEAVVTDKLAATLDKMGATLDRLASLADRIGQQSVAAPAPGSIEAKPFVPPPPPVVPPAAASGPSPQSFAAAFNVFGQSCKKCHSGPSAAKGFKLFEADGKPSQLTPLQLYMAWNAIDGGSMPQDAPALDGDAYDSVHAYVLENGDAIAAALKACMEKSK